MRNFRRDDDGKIRSSAMTLDRGKPIEVFYKNLTWCGITLAVADGSFA